MKAYIEFIEYVKELSLQFPFKYIRANENTMINRNYFIDKWNQKTIHPNYTYDPQLPEKGQCLVTALIVQDKMGGEIVKCNKLNHYFNLIDNQIIDLTIGQFTEAQQKQITIDSIIDRKQVLKGHTLKRYLELNKT